MTGAPQGACSGRAPPSLRSPPAITTIHLPGGTYRKIWTQLYVFLPFIEKLSFPLTEDRIEIIRLHPYIHD